jgi:general secretion pathway protein L
MSTLVVQIPPRLRLRARSSDAVDPESRSGVDYQYALTSDGLALNSEGQCAPSLLPKATSVVAVLSDADVSWHRITLPKAPAARLQAALVGVLEDALLEDAEGVHLAVAPGASAGEPTWVAAVDRAWLAGELAVLEKSLVFVDRVVPVAWPDEPPCGHFEELSAAAQRPGEESTGVALSWAHAEGVVFIPLQGSLARSLLPTPLPEGTHWTATPGVAATAEGWLGTSVSVTSTAHRALKAARSLWNLRQFTLARKNRGSRALRDVWRQFQTPTWRPLRYGIIALIVVQIVGLNLWAAHQGSQLAGKKKSMLALLQATFPNVRGGLDVPLEMQRETDSLRTAAGKPGDADFEPLMQAAASAWPPDRPPVDQFKFEPGRLTLKIDGWSPEQVERFSSQLRPSGWQVDANEGLLVLSRASSNATLPRSKS